MSFAYRDGETCLASDEESCGKQHGDVRIGVLIRMNTELSHRTITRIGRYRSLDIGSHSRETLLALFRQMLRLRATEEALHREYHPADEMRCPIHFCIGQEAVPAALSLLLQRDDFLFSHHRSHGYYFAKGAPLKELFAEIYGKETGANGGRAGSQDISHPDSRFFSGAILGGAISIAVGAAFALKHRGVKQVSVSGFGEGATDEGAVWEAMNYAGKQKLPMLFVIENNRYATFSDQLKRQAADNICERARPFGVRATQIFGNDVVKVYDTLNTEIEALRQGDGPSLVEAYTYRWNSHVGPEDDSVNNYRTVEEMAFWKENCPIKLLEEKLHEAGHLTGAVKARMEIEIGEEIADNFRFAKESPFPKDIDWQDANWSSSSPLADALLIETERNVFDHNQAEARLGPY
jgi:TPP-dependent pyruvate/acetoin dehydrogenase alpha subunit